MIPGPTRCRWLNALKTELVQIQFIDEDIDYSNRIGFSYVILKRLGQQYALGPAFALNKSLHKNAPLVDPLIRISTHTAASAFTSDTTFPHGLGRERRLPILAQTSHSP